MKGKLCSAKSLCVLNGLVYVCSADGIIVVEHSNTSKVTLKIQSLRKDNLIAKLRKRIIEATRDITEEPEEQVQSSN